MIRPVTAASKCKRHAFSMPLHIAVTRVSWICCRWVETSACVDLVTVEFFFHGAVNMSKHNKLKHSRGSNIFQPGITVMPSNQSNEILSLCQVMFFELSL